jgi:hypothetical protein
LAKGITCDNHQVTIVFINCAANVISGIASERVAINLDAGTIFAVNVERATI